ncbi:MAG: RNA 2',3'-cyclic phosphodiesterase [Gemmatimonadota bacterium]
MRLFIALNLPKKERTRIHRAARVLREADIPVRWVEPEHYHVTLKFLGQIRKDDLPKIEAALARAAEASRPFTTGLGGFGAFPTVRRPRVLWLGVGANPELRCLKQDIEWALGDAGFDAETRAFHPHITLGRAEEGGGAGEFRGLDDIVAAITFSGEIKVHTVDLMSSRLSREGPNYSIVSSVKLSG